QSVPPNGSPSTVAMMSSSRWRADNGRGLSPDRTRRTAETGDAQYPDPVDVKPTVSTEGSDASVTAAIAEDATRGLRPMTPPTAPMVIDPDTSSASIVRLPAGSTLPKAV